jgi:catechol 2,3-dioxygenase-like lactoylglutathione lyase family enzyme
MIDHVALHVTDVDRSRRFYEQALAPLGYAVAMEMEGFIGFAYECSLQFVVRSGREHERARRVPGTGSFCGRCVPRCGDVRRRHGRRSSGRARALPPLVLRRLRLRSRWKQYRGRLPQARVEEAAVDREREV